MKLLLSIVLLTLGALKVYGQPDTCAPLLQAVLNATTPDQRNNAIGELTKLGGHPLCFAEIVTRSPSGERAAYVSFIKNLEAHRTDKQAGSSTGTGGTTNLVSKGVTAQALSVAAEYGALTESVSSQVVTLQGSLDGIPTALIRQGFVRYCPKEGQGSEDRECIHQSLLGFLRRISYGVSFNTSTNSQAVTGTATGPQTGSAQLVTFTPSGNQISSATGRVVLWNARDATSSTFQEQWKKALNPGTGAKTNSSTASQPPQGGANGAASGTAKDATKSTCSRAGDNTTKNGSGGTNRASPAFLDSAADTLMSALESLIPRADNKIWKDWANRANQALKGARDTDLGTVWEHCSLQLIDLLQGKSSANQCGGDPQLTDADKKKFSDPNLPDHAISFIQASSEYRFEEDQFVACMAEKPVLTLEYDYNQALNQISTSTVRLIFDKGFKKNWSVTFNGAFAIYDSTPSSSIPGASRLRDSQVGVQVDRKLPALSFLGTPSLNGAYYFQYQNSPSILNVTPSTPLAGIALTGLSGSATQVFAQKGNLHVGQLKLVLGSGQSSVRFPLAFSYSNRTDLIAKPVWRGQIGISYDFDALFAK